MDEFLQRQQGTFWIIAQMHVQHTQPGFCECPEINFGLSSLDHAEPGVMSGDYKDALGLPGGNNFFRTAALRSGE